MSENVSTESNGAAGTPGVTEATEEAKPAVDTSTVDALKAELAAQREATEATRAEMGQLKSFTTALVAQMQQGMGAGGGVPEDDDDTRKSKLRESLVKDPEAFLDAHFRARTEPIVAEQLESLVGLNRELTAARTGDTWKKYEKQVDILASQMNPRFLAKKGSYDTLLRMVRADFVDDEVEEKFKQRMERSASGFVEPASGAAPSTPKVPTLNDVEKKIAAGMQISDDEYIKWRDA